MVTEEDFKDHEHYVMCERRKPRVWDNCDARTKVKVN